MHVFMCTVYTYITYAYTHIYIFIRLTYTFIYTHTYIYKLHFGPAIGVQIQRQEMLQKVMKRQTLKILEVL